MCSGIQDHDDPRFGCDCHLFDSDTKVKTGEHCHQCGYEFVIFPEGEDERDLADSVSTLDGRNEYTCIDCMEKNAQPTDDTVCKQCGAPFNDADTTESGLCPACEA